MFHELVAVEPFQNLARFITVSAQPLDMSKGGLACRRSALLGLSFQGGYGNVSIESWVCENVCMNHVVSAFDSYG